jgi:DNA polymerase V
MYASCEKIFDPSIRKRPVVVLSNNDGCVVALCPLAKRLGIPKFGPYFKIRGLLDQYGVVVRSSNYELYADISQRMMHTCAQFAPDQHIYSIDECFLGYGYYVPEEGWQAHGRSIRRTIWKEVRLPVGVGIAATPTLAKAANFASKRLEGFNGVAVIDSEHVRKHVLQQMSVTDVWGIGRRLGKQMQALGIETAWALANTPTGLLKKHFNVLVERCARELNGQVCLSWDDVRAPKQQIYSTRSFGRRVTQLSDLKMAVCKHVEIAAQKLRAQDSVARTLIVFAHNSPHDQEPFYRRSLLHRFAAPTADTGIIAKVASQMIEGVFAEGVRFYKCGVGLIDLLDGSACQDDLFTPSEDRQTLMTCMDQINQRYGRSTLKLARHINETSFAMRRERLSPRATTRLDELPVFWCK